MEQQPRSILITGASSGIGAALAKIYAEPETTLFLGGRHRERLAAVATTCRALGATVHEHIHDVDDAEGMAAWVHGCDGRAPLDLVIANAGVSAGTGFAGEGTEQARRIFAINVDGALNTVLPVLPAMVERGHGQLALTSSIASFRGFPGAPAYCASKAALRIWGEGQRGWLHNKGVKLSVICPGFIRTPMSDGNPYPMPFLMDADRAARIIKRGLTRNKARIAFPWQTYGLAQLLAFMPVALSDRILRRMPNKPSMGA
ncbi:MAG: SDR family NAD(P)-dependent oxidoreductase [Rhodospirillales bacterium]|nr:SDR family NAD(P)-dependent oxidoreductase [Rhodospirillales bacterium]